jgi:cyclophilin family peptidyl-prolyl cis-trans isomerase
MSDTTPPKKRFHHRATFKCRTVLAMALLFVIPSPLFAQAESVNTAEMSFDEKVSYIIGHQFAGNLQKMDIPVELEPLLRGLREALTGQPCAFSRTEQTTIMAEFKTKREGEDSSASRDPSWKTKLQKPELMTFDANTDYYWILETNKGTITIKLMPDVAPMHVTSTVFLTEKGFYDNLTFHRVIPGFMAQGGCPLGTGTGGPGYQYAGEFKSDVRHDRPYLLSMANAGPHTDGSQFFLTFVPTPHLDGKHTIFGEITEGKEVMKKLEAAGTSPAGKTKEKLFIKKARIEKKPKG